MKNRGYASDKLLEAFQTVGEALQGSLFPTHWGPMRSFPQAGNAT